MKVRNALLSGITLAVTLAFAGAAPASAMSHHRPFNTGSNPDKPNLVQTAVAVNAQSGEFSTLIAAVSCTNLANKLSREAWSYTVFAPTDAAFAKLGLNKDNVCSTFSRAQLTKILRYHVTRGELKATDVLAQSSLRMLSGQRAHINGATIAGQNIVQTDVVTSNGVIHVIDGVMLP